MRPVCQHDFSTLYTTLPHNLIKEKIINLPQDQDSLLVKRRNDNHSPEMDF